MVGVNGYQKNAYGPLCSVRINISVKSHAFFCRIEKRAPESRFDAETRVASTCPISPRLRNPPKPSDVPASQTTLFLRVKHGLSPRLFVPMELGPRKTGQDAKVYPATSKGYQGWDERDRKFTAFQGAGGGFEALRGDRTIQRLRRRHNCAPDTGECGKERQACWKGNGLTVFAKGSAAMNEREAEVKGASCQESGGWRSKTIFSQRAQAMSPGDRRDLIQPESPKLNSVRQCRALNISNRRCTIGLSRPVAETLGPDLKVIDKLFTRYPFFGSRQIRGLSGTRWDQGSGRPPVFAA